MAAISTASIITLADKLTAYWLACLGTDAGQMGMRTEGATGGGWAKADDIVDLVLALADIDQIVSLADAARTLRTATDAYNSVGALAAPFVNALNQEALRSAGVAGIANVNTLDTFLTYYNTGDGGDFACLMPPDFRAMYYAAKKAYPSAWNVYFEVIQGATYANGLRKLVVTGAGTGNQTAGEAISSSNYAGGVGKIIVSGITGSGVVTVTGTWRLVDGTVTTGDGSVTASANTTYTLTPPATGALLLTVTGIAAANGITAGTIYAEAHRPAGRTNPPT